MPSCRSPSGPRPPTPPHQRPPGGGARCGIVVYYCVLLAWCLRYMLATLAAVPSGQLPWAGGNSSRYFQGEVRDPLPSQHPSTSTTLTTPLYFQGEVLDPAAPCPGGAAPAARARSPVLCFPKPIFPLSLFSPISHHPPFP